MSLQQLGLKGQKDAALLRRLAEFDYPPVLVTADSKLAVENAALILDGRLTVAEIEQRAQPGDLTLTQYFREVVHRHAHRFVEQEPATAWRYRASARRTRINLEDVPPAGTSQ